MMNNMGEKSRWISVLLGLSCLGGSQFAYAQYELIPGAPETYHADCSLGGQGSQEDFTKAKPENVSAMIAAGFTYCSGKSAAPPTPAPKTGLAKIPEILKSSLIPALSAAGHLLGAALESPSADGLTDAQRNQCKALLVDDPYSGADPTPQLSGLCLVAERLECDSYRDRRAGASKENKVPVDLVKEMRCKSGLDPVFVSDGVDVEKTKVLLDSIGEPECGDFHRFALLARTLSAKKEYELAERALAVSQQASGKCEYASDRAVDARRKNIEAGYEDAPAPAVDSGDASSANPDAPGTPRDEDVYAEYAE